MEQSVNQDKIKSIMVMVLRCQ